MARTVTNIVVRRQYGSENTIYATWTWNVKNTENYEILWCYYTAGTKQKPDKTWFIGSETTSKYPQSTYDPPDNAVAVSIKVKPVAKNQRTNNQDKPYWTAIWSKFVIFSLNNQVFDIEAPSVPSVDVSGLNLTAVLDIYDKKATHIDFQVVKNHASVYKTGRIPVKTNHAAFSCKLQVNGSYKVRARAVSIVTTYVTSKSSPKNKTKKLLTFVSDWSEYTDSYPTAPGKIDKITRLKALSATSVQVGFYPVPTAESYEIQYTTKKKYFDRNQNEVQSVTIDAVVWSAIITGLEGNQNYHFRARAINGAGNGPWSDIYTLFVGAKPAAPTTWCDSVVMAGEEVVLSWAHNTNDGSDQKGATIHITAEINESLLKERTITIDGDAQEYKFYPTDFRIPVNSKITWKVKTCGATLEYGEWSVSRTIDIYENVSANVAVYGKVQWLWNPFNFTTDNIATAAGEASEPITTVTAYPLNVQIDAYPEYQEVIYYAITITANTAYERLDASGSEYMVSEGDVIYQNDIYENVSNKETIRLSAGDLDLENGASYTVTADVAYSNGLSTRATYDFDVAWDPETYEPDARIAVDYDTLTATIQPFCTDIRNNETNDAYLSVYRRDFDGKFTEIASNIDAADKTTIVDPHPPLNIARYRIVAVSKKTGSVSFYDAPGYPVNYGAVVIQWSEEWSDYNIDDPDEMEQPPWTGSMVTLPYNIDTTEEVNPDVQLVNYAGRENPVSYYGTIKNESASWTVIVPYDDTDTIYALRRLAKYMGDAYVREPSGVGYWARVMVTIAQSHDSPAATITLGITRVEGGV